MNKVLKNKFDKFIKYTDLFLKLEEYYEELSKK